MPAPTVCLAAALASAALQVACLHVSSSGTLISHPANACFKVNPPTPLPPAPSPPPHCNTTATATCLTQLLQFSALHLLLTWPVLVACVPPCTICVTLHVFTDGCRLKAKPALDCVRDTVRCPMPPAPLLRCACSRSSCISRAASLSLYQLLFSCAASLLFAGSIAHFTAPPPSHLRQLQPCCTVSACATGNGAQLQRGVRAPALLRESNLAFV